MRDILTYREKSVIVKCGCNGWLRYKLVLRKKKDEREKRYF